MAVQFACCRSAPAVAAAAAWAATAHLLQTEQLDFLLCFSPLAGFRLHSTTAADESHYRVIPMLVTKL
jgi:hypothetical protein